MRVIYSLILLLPAFCHAIGTPFGFASGTTGGGSLTPVVPSSLEELITFLSDDQARVIELDRTFDFSTYFGTTTGTVCAPWTCSPNPQGMINTSNNWCSPYPDSTTTATYNNAGVTSTLAVGSNKSLIGKGTAGAIKGVGLSIVSSKNVIIQNIAISDINAQYVWGGDAISISGSSNVWIDHNTITRIGRQMVVTGLKGNTGVTISNNIFDGRTTFSTSCNGMHYWVNLFLGDGDQLTVAQNHYYNTDGRGPHIGGADFASGVYKAHLVNNYYDNVDGHALDVGAGAYLLAEGNYFKKVTTPSLDEDAGAAYFMQTEADTTACQSALGRECMANALLLSGTVSRVDSAALSTLGSLSPISGYVPMNATYAAAYVQANAGVGIIN